MKTMRVFSVVLVLAFLMTGIYAQDNSGQKPASQPGIEQNRPKARMNPQMRERMKARAQEMNEKHQKMMEEMKKMDETLQQKVDAMNAATGEQKVTAMADVINEMVKERKIMHENMATMHKDMSGHMMMMDHMGGGMMNDMGTTGTMSNSEEKK